MNTIPAQPVTAYIALGSNLGDRAALIRGALHALDDTDAIQVTRVSSLLENPAVGGPSDSPPFLNAAAEVQTSLAPEELLARMLQIERQLGRERCERWSPRTIDLDLLLYADQVIDSPRLRVPHARMHERRFVLEPLAEIAADARHPILKKTVDQLLRELAGA